MTIKKAIYESAVKHLDTTSINGPQSTLCAVLGLVRDEMEQSIQDSAGTAEEKTARLEEVERTINEIEDRMREELVTADVGTYARLFTKRHAELIPLFGVSFKTIVQGYRRLKLAGFCGMIVTNEEVPQ